MRDSIYERYRDTLRKGHVAAVQGQDAEALEAYAEAAEIMPQRAAPLVGRGRVELGLGRDEAAVVSFEAALALDPEDADALDGLERALVSLRAARGSAGGGEAWLGELEASDAEDEGMATGGEEVGTASEPAMPSGLDPEVARSLGERVEAADKAGDVRGLLDGAVALAEAGCLRTGVDAAHDALSLAPTDPDVHRTLAWLYRRGGSGGVAREKLALLDRYLAILDDPAELDRLAEAGERLGDVAALVSVAERHGRQGRDRAAADALFDALVLAPDDVAAHLALVRLHLVAGARGSAIGGLELLLKIIDLDANDEARGRLTTFVRTELDDGPMAAIPAL
ncbi:MAG: tetratricopeptide repeat protein [Chloroflexota bacterium]